MARALLMNPSIMATHWNEQVTLPALARGAPTTSSVVVEAEVWGGRYAPRRWMQTGGMAVIFEAEDLVTGARVAVKRLKAEYACDAAAVERFEREGRLLASIDHPNVVRRLDAGSDASGAPYLVLEHLTGEDLQARITREGRMGVRETFDAVRPALAGLAATHARRIVHHDVKPANIFLVREACGTPSSKLLDFGIACEAIEPEKRSQTVLGTLHYIAPEQMVGEGAGDPRVDVWAVGAVLYTCLAGKAPHSAETMPELMYKLMTEDPTPLESLRPDLPDALASVVRRALARDPRGRYDDAAEVLRALDASDPATALTRRAIERARSRRQPLPAVVT